MEVLTQNENILSLNFEKNQITSKGLEFLTKVIIDSEKPLKIKDINISRNEFGNS